MLVGRVDDDTGQAHDPATFVPALFVDNPWSKALGRDVQGFDKRLADFCTSRGYQPIALRPDGRPPGPSRSRSRAAHPHQGSPPDPEHRNGPERPQNSRARLPVRHDEDATTTSTRSTSDLALGTSSFAPTRWRQSDFGDLEFRRSFAREAIPKTLAGIRSVQVSPIGEPRLREGWQSETTWITGTFALDGGARIARPNGTVGLTLVGGTVGAESVEDALLAAGHSQGREREAQLSRRKLVPHALLDGPRHRQRPR